jgi:hypothetical protein
MDAKTMAVDTTGAAPASPAATAQLHVPAALGVAAGGGGADPDVGEPVSKKKKKKKPRKKRTLAPTAATPPVDGSRFRAYVDAIIRTHHGDICKLHREAKVQGVVILTDQALPRHIVHVPAATAKLRYKTACASVETDFAEGWWPVVTELHLPGGATLAFPSSVKMDDIGEA